MVDNVVSDGDDGPKPVVICIHSVVGSDPSHMKKTVRKKMAFRLQERKKKDKRPPSCRRRGRKKSRWSTRHLQYIFFSLSLFLSFGWRRNFRSSPVVVDGGTSVEGSLFPWRYSPTCCAPDLIHLSKSHPSGQQLLLHSSGTASLTWRRRRTSTWLRTASRKSRPFPRLDVLLHVRRPYISTDDLQDNFLFLCFFVVNLFRFLLFDFIQLWFSPLCSQLVARLHHCQLDKTAMSWEKIIGNNFPRFRCRVVFAVVVVEIICGAYRAIESRDGERKEKTRRESSSRLHNRCRCRSGRMNH